MRSKRGFFLATAVVLALLGGAYWQLSGKTEKAGSEEAAGKTALASRGEIQQQVETTGSVEANLEVEIKSRASGQITSLTVDLSDWVSQGDLLVELDPIYEKRSLERARVALDSARARHIQAGLNLRVAEQTLITEEQRARADLRSTEAQAVEAAASFQRSQELLAASIVSQEELDASRSQNARSQAALQTAKARIADLATSRIQLESRQQDILIAASEVTENEIALAEAEQRLSDTRILAPIDGVVTSRGAELGQIVASAISNVGGGSALMELADLSRCFVVASVDESDIGKVRVGQAAELTADAFSGQTFSGKVVRVASKGQVVSNVVTFLVKIEVLGEGVRLLRPEMTANVSIVTARAEQAIRVPALAVTHRRGEAYVVCLGAEGKREERRVEVGLSDLEFIQILAGVEPGERVVLEDVTRSSRWRADQKSGEDDPRRRERMQVSMIGAGGPPP